MKKDTKYLEEGRVFLSSILRNAVARGAPPHEAASIIREQFIDVTGATDSKLDDWTCVLMELSEQAPPLGNYARAVKELIKGESFN